MVPSSAVLAMDIHTLAYCIRLCENTHVTQELELSQGHNSLVHGEHYVGAMSVI